MKIHPDFAGLGPIVLLGRARYFLDDPPEKGLLQQSWREFREGQAQGPDGCGTLTRVLGSEDLAGFQVQGQESGLGRRFP